LQEWTLIVLCKKGFKIPKGYSENINQHQQQQNKTKQTMIDNTLLYRYRWNSELNKKVKLPFLFHSRYISRHFVVDVIWRHPVWNVKIRRYLASCTLQFGSNLTKIIFQGNHFNYFIVVGGWRHVFWSDTHYSISLRYTRNIVQLTLLVRRFQIYRTSYATFIFNVIKIVQKRLENGSFDGSRCVLYNAFVLASYWL
jgi:hypothetical protein